MCVLGSAGAAWLATRRGAAVAGLGLAFAGLGVRQIVMLYSGRLPAPDPTALGAELALLAASLGGAVALRAIHRTTRERDRAEDLHWDSMEAVRVMSELAARPGARLEDKLATMLDLGTTRFGLELGAAWLTDAQDAPGPALGVRAPGLDDAQREAWMRALAPRLADATRATRPALLLDRNAAPHVFFAVAVASGGQLHGVLAFAGGAAAESRFTATDKDLLGLMAQWLASEIERRAPAPEAPTPEAPAAAPSLAQVARAALRPRRGIDVAHTVSRLERRLRQRVGTDGTLTIEFEDGLPPLARGQLSLPRLVESLVDAAARLSPTGRISVVAEPPEESAAELTLQVRVRGSEIEADALQRAFDANPSDEEAPPGVLPLHRVERLLRADGGDLSVSVEPREGATLTVWLPLEARDIARPVASPPAQA